MTVFFINNKYMWYVFLVVLISLISLTNWGMEINSATWVSGGIGGIAILIDVFIELIKKK